MHRDRGLVLVGPLNAIFILINGMVRVISFNSGQSRHSRLSQSTHKIDEVEAEAHLPFTLSAKRE